MIFKKALILSLSIVIILIPCSVFAEETYTFSEDELYDTICEAVQNDPVHYGVVSGSDYEELERDYRTLSEHMPDPEKQEKQNDRELISLGILAAAIVFGYYKLYMWGKRKEEDALNKASKEFLRGYKAAKDELETPNK